MKILISDFDNTFYTDKVEDNVIMVNKFIDEGNIFIIATGRPIYLLREDLKKYNIRYNYLICNDGAVVFNKNEEVIHKINIDYHSTIEIYNALKRNIDIEHVYVDAIYDFGELDSKDYNGILALPYDINNMNNILNDIIRNYPNVQAYLSHKWLNILSIDASKGNAIKYLQSKNNWNENDIYVIGDNNNDISMTIFDNSYAVSYGKQSFINKCNYTVKDFNELIKKIL